MGTDSHNLFKVKQPAIFLSKMIACWKVHKEENLKTMAQNKTTKTNWSNNKVSTIRTAFQ